MAILVLLGMLVVLSWGDLALRIAAWRNPQGLAGYITSSHRRIAGLLISVASLITRFRFRVDPWTGDRLPDRLLLVSNHQSLIDIPGLTIAFPRHVLRFVAKRELGRGVPYVSLALRRGGHALISRNSDYREGAQELRRFARRSVCGVSPVVFPEGTRSRDGNLLPFNAGAFRILLDEAPLPVLSVAIDGAWMTATLSGIVTSLGRTRYRIKPIALHPPPRGKREIIGLLATLEGEIAAQLAEWRRIS